MKTSERNALVLKHRPLVLKLVKRFIRRNPDLASFEDDLIQDGSFAVLRAAENFETAGKAKFITYAWINIDRYLLDRLPAYRGLTSRPNWADSRYCQPDIIAKDIEGNPIDPADVLPVDDTSERTTLMRQLYPLFREKLAESVRSRSKEVRDRDRKMYLEYLDGTDKKNYVAFAELARRYDLSRSRVQQIIYDIDDDLLKWGRRLEGEAA